MTRPAFADIFNLEQPFDVIAGGASQLRESAEANALAEEAPTEIDKFIAKRRSKRTRR